MTKYASTFDRVCMDIEDKYRMGKIQIYSEYTLADLLHSGCQTKLGEDVSVKNKKTWGHDIEIYKGREPKLFAEVKITSNASERYATRKPKYFDAIERIRKGNIATKQRQGRFVIFDRTNSIKGTRLERDVRKKCEQSGVKLIILRGNRVSAE